MTEVLSWLARLPDPLVYVALSLGAAAENLIPAVPADTFVALGGFLSGLGELRALPVFLGTWLCNVAGAFFVYRMSRLHGPAFFRAGLGRRVVRPSQMARMQRFYDRWGPGAIFLSRFLPGFRAIVPVFAGATHQGSARVLIPIATASALWYGGLVRLGVLAGENVWVLDAVLGRITRVLALVAVVLGSLTAWWWYRTRHPDAEDEDEDRDMTP